MQQFWYVYNLDSGKPIYRHQSFESAEKEAQRLISTVGGTYYILEAESVVEEAPRYVTKKLEDYPF